MTRKWARVPLLRIRGATTDRRRANHERDASWSHEKARVRLMGSVVRGATVVKKWQRNVSAPTCSFESRVRWCPTRAQFRRDSRRTADFRESRVASERSPRLAPRRAARHSRRYVSLETALWRRVASASRCYTLAWIFIINSSSYKREMSPFARVGEITRFPSDGSKCRLIAADVYSMVIFSRQSTLISAQWFIFIMIGFYIYIQRRTIGKNQS